MVGLLRTALAAVIVIPVILAVEITDYPDEVEAGKGYEITWDPDDGDTTFVLRKGDPEALDTIATLTTDATGGSWYWRPDTDLVNADDYALEIQQGDENNYSGQISLTGGTDA